MISWSWLAQTCWQEGMNPFVHFTGASWNAYLLFQVRTSSHFAFLHFRPVLGCSGHVSVFAIRKLLVLQQLAHSLLQRQPVTVHEVLFFLGKTTICVNGHAQLCLLCCVIQVIC